MPAIRIAEFDIWRPGYADAIVTVYLAGTTTEATIYTDEALTQQADNPQTLQSRSINGTGYGKFAAPLYVGLAYELHINSAEQTGVIRPALTTLSGQDASDSLVTVTGGTQARNLKDILANVIDAAAHGLIGPAVGAATNNATLVIAAGIAAGDGGGVVLVPDGLIPYTSFTLAAGVIIQGRGRGVTTLQSTIATKVVTLGGDRAGFSRLTLDGASKQAGSIGVYSKAKNETYFDDVEVKRFETGVKQMGGRRANWRELYIENCVNGVLGYGDNDASGGANGDEYRHNRWDGGRVTNCTTVGVDLGYVDKKCWHNTISDVGFEDNTGIALRINGARHTQLPGCWWKGNTIDWDIRDHVDTSHSAENTVIGVTATGGSISGGAVNLRGTLQDVMLDGVEISDVDFTLTSPGNNIVLRDCVEDALVTIAGDGTKVTRCWTMLGDWPQSSGLTTDATATKAWAITLDPGQVVHIEAVVVANQRNGEDRSIFHIARPARRPGSTLAYDTQTVNFTLGATLTGATSGATARIVADADGGAAGTLTLRDISGDFVDNEIIADSSGGSATANGTLVSASAALLGATTSIEAAVESDAATACDFAASGPEIQIQVTGIALKTFEWTVSVKVTSS